MLPTTTRNKFTDTQPLKTLAKAAGSCSVESGAYAKCVGSRYLEVSKGMCEVEFVAFKQCVQKAMGRKW
ncbi:hypothetical protein M231_08022 [Tremella mesenterica]|uniref:IMS import disulfide relay-system CHCH-CHCH-like Cx9C domain-containing protein n=1 Tax=Tremella mesenterica TaxID=5217 RepID=A0A4Q1BAM6_TREME|nr:hypothetical protein M231_08022 [Tremella mesenterica]